MARVARALLFLFFNAFNKLMSLRSRLFFRAAIWPSQPLGTHQYTGAYKATNNFIIFYAHNARCRTPESQNSAEMFFLTGINFVVPNTAPSDRKKLF